MKNFDPVVDFGDGLRPLTKASIAKIHYRIDIHFPFLENDRTSCRNHVADMFFSASRSF